MALFRATYILYKEYGITITFQYVIQKYYKMAEMAKKWPQDDHKMVNSVSIFVCISIYVMMSIFIM